MKAEITYTAGRTYRVKGVRFERGKKQLVKDPAIIRKCQQTVGFSVQVLEAESPKAPAKKVLREPVPKSKSTTKLSSEKKLKS